MQQRPCVLFVAEAVTLAHVVRLVTLARAAHASGLQVVLATDPRYAALVGQLPFSVLPLHSMPPARFQQAITSGGPIFDFPTLSRYVDDDLALLRRMKPRVVVGDFRLSLSVSARVAGIPFVNLTNAYWSALARIRRVVPEFDWVRWLGVRLSQPVFRTFERLGYLHHVQPLNRVRRKHGLASIGSDFRTALTDGDVTCFSDWPEIIPTAPLPATQHFIGPVPWSPSVALPPWWQQMCGAARKRPLVYVTLGSSGPAAALPQVLAALAAMPVDVMVATAGRAQGLQLPANACAAALLPGDQACAAADLVICNGGSPGTYQALQHGKPVVGIAANMDQFLNMAAVQDAGFGRLLRARAVTVPRTRRVVSDMLDDGALRQRTSALAASKASLSATQAFATVALHPWLS